MSGLYFAVYLILFEDYICPFPKKLASHNSIHYLYSFLRFSIHLIKLVWFLFWSSSLITFKATWRLIPYLCSNTRSGALRPCISGQTGWCVYLFLSMFLPFPIHLDFPFRAKYWLRAQVAQARNMSIGEHRHCCVTYKGKPLYREKTVYIKTHKTAINRPVDHTGET